MQDYSNSKLPIFSGEIRSPIKRFLKKPEILKARAEFYQELGLSGDDTVDWILDQIYNGHSGNLIDFNGYEIDLKRWLVHELWGEEPRSAMNAYKRRAYAKTAQRLHENLVEREMAHDFAIQIYRARIGLAS